MLDELGSTDTSELRLRIIKEINNKYGSLLAPVVLYKSEFLNVKEINDLISADQQNTLPNPLLGEINKNNRELYNELAAIQKTNTFVNSSDLMNAYIKLKFGDNTNLNGVKINEQLNNLNTLITSKDFNVDSNEYDTAAVLKNNLSLEFKKPEFNLENLSYNALNPVIKKLLNKSNAELTQADQTVLETQIRTYNKEISDTNQLLNKVTGVEADMYKSQITKYKAMIAEIEGRLADVNNDMPTFEMLSKVKLDYTTVKNLLDPTKSSLQTIKLQALNPLVVDLNTMINFKANNKTVNTTVSTLLNDYLNSTNKDKTALEKEKTIISDILENNIARNGQLELELSRLSETDLTTAITDTQTNIANTQRDLQALFGNLNPNYTFAPQTFQTDVRTYLNSQQKTILEAQFKTTIKSLENSPSVIKYKDLILEESNSSTSLAKINADLAKAQKELKNATDIQNNLTYNSSKEDKDAVAKAIKVANEKIDTLMTSQKTTSTQLNAIKVEKTALTSNQNLADLADFQAYITQSGTLENINSLKEKSDSYLALKQTELGLLRRPTTTPPRVDNLNNALLLAQLQQNSNTKTEIQKLLNEKSDLLKPLSNMKIQTLKENEEFLLQMRGIDALKESITLSRIDASDILKNYNNITALAKWEALLESADVSSLKSNIDAFKEYKQKNEANMKTLYNELLNKYCEPHTTTNNQRQPVTLPPITDRSSIENIFGKTSNPLTSLLQNVTIPQPKLNGGGRAHKRRSHYKRHALTVKHKNNNYMRIEKLSIKRT
jgi:hypothetical protein